MKAIIFSLFLILTTTVSLKAQKLIAVQSGDNATFYTSLDTALLHANDGDDIYLPGGYVKTNGVIKIDKGVNIIGVGYNPLSNAATENTILGCPVIKIMPTAIGASITGILAKNCQLVIQDTVSKININRCFFHAIYIGSGLGNVPPSDIRIAETIVDYQVKAYSNPAMNDDSEGPQNVSILNCIIGKSSEWNTFGSDPGLLWHGLTCKNSIIIGLYDYNSTLSNIQYSVFENDIIVNSYPYTYFSIINNTFRNCMFTNSGVLSDSNVVDNCFFSQPQDAIFNDPQGYVFNMKNDYHLRADSPGKNAGRDGTDIGIYGGAFPWKEGGLPANPHVESQVIDGSSGNLKVNIKVVAQDH